MADSSEHRSTAGDGGQAPGAQFVTIPVRARDEIGELAFYLDQVRQNLLEVNVHLTGSSRTMPGVLHDLKDIVQMTEKATVRVLEETEALLDESQAVSTLIARVRQTAGIGEMPGISEPLSEAQTLVESGNRRALAIMSALEFQDLTSQKVQRAFEVLEEVATRLGKIHGLVALGKEVRPEPVIARAQEPAPPGGKSGQDLADEILQRFRG